MRTLGLYIAHCRAERNVSLRQAAKSAGFSAAYWSDIENDKRVPSSRETLTKISRAVGADMATMLSLAAKRRGKPDDDSEMRLLAARSIFDHEVSEDTLRKIMKLIHEDDG